MTLSTIHWVPVQDKGSTILCVKWEAMKIIPSDRLHQEYLTIIFGVLVIAAGSSEALWEMEGQTHSMNHSLSHSLTLFLQRMHEQESYCQFPFQTLMQLVRMAHPVIYSECKGQRAVGGGVGLWKEEKDYFCRRRGLTMVWVGLWIW